MADKRMTFTSWFLLVLTAGFFGLIGVLVYWGGRIESTLLVHGEPVFVVVDAGQPKIWLLFSLPTALLAGALAARKVRNETPT
ncbi:MAG: hypothetical protein ACC649_05870 [Myxococcota bacterium]